MPRRLVALVATLLLGVVVLAPGMASAQQDAPLNLAVRDTRLLDGGVTELVVNVTGPAKPDVLAAEAFTMIEQGETIEDLEVVPLLEAGAIDLAVSVAVDVSGSMEGEPMVVTREATVDLVRQLTELGVQVQLIAFASTVEILTDFTTDTDTVVAAAEGLEAAGATLLYDAVVTASNELAQLDAQRNLIVFSDGGDNGSESTLQEAIRAAQAAETPIVTIAFETPDLDPEALDAMAAQTDGRVLTAAQVDELDALFEEVASDIASFYILRYTSANFEPDTLSLQVAVAAGGAEASASFVVPNVRETPPLVVEPRIVDGGPGILATPAVFWTAIAATFVALALLFAFLFTGARTPADKVLSTHLERYIEGGDVRAGRSSAVAAHFRDRAMEIFEATPRPKGLDAKLSRRLEQAAWPLRNSEFMAFVILLGLGVGLLVGILVNVLGGILLGIVAGSVPFAILAIRRQRRHDAFLRNLPDTLQLMAGSLRAGYGVLQAIDSVSKESSPPTSEEFARVITEARLGMPLEDALQAMAERIDNADFRWVVMAIIIQREVGGNLAELLDTVSEVLREREMLRRQIKVLSAEGRLSAWILIGLPIFLAIYLILVRPEYIATLVTSGAFGWALVIAACVLMVIGVLWIRKLIRIEV
jgi:tight adherence protein B